MRGIERDPNTPLPVKRLARIARFGARVPAVPTYAEAFQEIGTSLLNMPVVLAVVVLACTCFFIAPATPHALLVTKVAAWGDLSEPSR